MPTAIARCLTRWLKAKTLFFDAGSWWQVLPAYKFRSEGDKVRWDDAIVLVNAAAGGHHTGHYLHIAESESPSGRGGEGDTHPYVEMSFEVNVSAAAMSRFRVQAYRSCERQVHSLSVASAAPNSPELVLGGDVVYIFHKEGQQDVYYTSTYI